MEHTRELDVVDVSGATGEEADIFAPLDRAANVTLPGWVFHLHRANALRIFSELHSRFHDRIDDRLVAGAAAEIA